MMKGLCWFRRDLRLEDHHALSMATKECDEVHVIFIFDNNILEKLPKEDQRLSFIIDSLFELQEKVNFHLDYGDPTELIPKYAKKLKVDKVFFNKDYEPYAKKRDAWVCRTLKKDNIDAESFLDHVFFETDKVLKGDGSPYRVFTPYKNRWLELFAAQEFLSPNFKVNLKKISGPKNSKSKEQVYKMIEANETTPYLKGGRKHGKKLLKKFLDNIDQYHIDRDFPYREGTSMLSVHFRFGTVSIREAVKLAHEQTNEGGRCWLSELIWREFYQMILDKFPHVEKKSFSSKYENIKWLGSSKNFNAWKEGRTGFPIVDAAMRCLNETGTMPNRLRMVVASFLCKTLLIDWKKGEKYFAEKLLDFDLAANNGGWQWCASTGCDAQPYFRIFNPWTQSKKFDPDGAFIRQFVPELKEFSNKHIHTPHELNPLEQSIAGCLVGQDYPEPIVDYKFNRDKALEMYKKA